MTKTRTSLIAIALSVLALGLIHGPAAHAQYLRRGAVFGPGGWVRPMYETYHAGNTDHFYTTNEFERDLAQSYGYAYYGVAFAVERDQQSYSVPLRRFYKYLPQTDHIYLTDPAEISFVLANGWVEEAPEGYIFTSQVWDDRSVTIPLYRLHKWNPATGDLDHLYTTNPYEVRYYQQYLGWGYDRIEGYVWPASYPY